MNRIDEQAEVIWDQLKHMTQLHADGMFTCTNKYGEKVLLMYSAEANVFMTCSVRDQEDEQD